MKKFLLPLFVILFSVASFINAQSDLSFGPIGGLNISTFNGKDANQLGNLSSKTGVYIGGFLNYRFSELFALQPEVVYTMKGADATVNINDVNANLTYSANYIEIPVLLKFYIPISGARTVKPSLYVGPAFAFNVSSNVTVSANNQTQTVDMSSSTKGFDFGVAFGGGVGFVLGKDLLDISVRYTLGITTTDNSPSNLSVTNGVFAIIAGFAFGI
jgi:hypothetical protein